ncbi:unnamed protein product [Rhodiola kirilowii]
MELDSGMSLGDISQFSGQMLENPPKKSGHRRVHSDIIMLPENLYFDPGMVGPSFSDEDLVSMYLDMDNINGSSCQGVAGPALALVPPTVLSAPQTGGRVAALADKPRIRHQHSQSMDGLSTIKPEMFMSGSEESSSASDSKKAMSAAKLVELALVDPKRAKRIWANRQSAARSKERKMRYIAELEWQFQSLQTKATSLTARLNLLQKDTIGLMAENNELKVRLQTIEQQVMLQDALNEGLKDEIQHMKVLTGQTMSNGGPMMNFPYGTTHYYHNNQAMRPLMAAQQFPHPHYHPHKQQHQFQQLQHQRRDQQLQQLHQPYQELPWQPNDATLTGSNSARLQKESDTDIKGPEDNGSTQPLS